MEWGLVGEYFKGWCFHFQGQCKTTWIGYAQNILDKTQPPADWCRTFSLVHVQMGSRSIANVARLSKLQNTSYLCVSCIMYQEEHEVWEFWMTQLDVGLTPPLPTSNLGSASTRGGKRIDLRPWL